MDHLDLFLEVGRALLIEKHQSSMAQSNSLLIRNLSNQLLCMLSL